MIQGSDPSAAFALDTHGLDALRLQAKRNPEQALKGVAQQFEALFIHTLLKTMREATPQEGPMESDQTRQYTAMLDQQLAQSLSARGIGLADVMLRQLMRAQGGTNITEPPPQVPVAPAPVNRTTRVPGAVKVTEPSVSNPQGYVPTPPVSAPLFRSTVDDRNQGEDFLVRMKEHALAASNATGIPARFLLGQAALESGWGRHEIRAADGSPSYNLFGIKAGGNWNGRSVEVMTTEYVDGVPQKVREKFRAYDSYAEAFQDYAALMLGNKRYAEVLRQRDGAGFAQGLQRAGYATDPRYAEKLTNILNGERMRRTIAI